MVQENLERTIQILRQHKSGGFALFSGKGKIYMIESDIIPWYYRCSNHFIALPMWLNDKKLIGCIAMDMNECAFGFIGDQVVHLKSITSGIAGKHDQGGQSQRRFERQRNMFKHFYFQRIAEYAREYFLDNKTVVRLVIHGESFTKKEFMDGKHLEYRLQNLSKISDGCYAGHDGLFEANNLIK